MRKATGSDEIFEEDRGRAREEERSRERGKSSSAAALPLRWFHPVGEETGGRLNEVDCLQS